MYATITFVQDLDGVISVQQRPWSMSAQLYAEQHSIDGKVQYSTGAPPATKSEVSALLLAQLAETDYQAIKYAEEQLTAQQYAPMKLQRQEWRNEYNSLQGDDTNG